MGSQYKGSGGSREHRWERWRCSSKYCDKAIRTKATRRFLTCQLLLKICVKNFFTQSLGGQTAEQASGVEAWLPPLYILRDCRLRKKRKKLIPNSGIISLLFYSIISFLYSEFIFNIFKIILNITLFLDNVCG